jgi:hypothetical protein
LEASRLVSQCYNLFMADTQATRDYLAAVKRAAAKLQKAEKAREKAEKAREEARRELLTAVQAAEAAELRPQAILRESGLTRASFYRLKRGEHG